MALAPDPGARLARHLAAVSQARADKAPGVRPTPAELVSGFADAAVRGGGPGVVPSADWSDVQTVVRAALAWEGGGDKDTTTPPPPPLSARQRLLLRLAAEAAVAGGLTLTDIEDAAGERGGALFWRRLILLPLHTVAA